MKVFIEKDGERKEVEVEKRTEGARQKFWFVEKKPEPQQRPEERKDDQPVPEETVDESDMVEIVSESATEDAPAMSEDAPSERELGTRCGCPRRSHPSKRRRKT